MYSMFNAAGMLQMLDDFFFIGQKHSQKRLHDLNQFMFMCKDSGITIKMETKTQLPTTVITIHGKKVDSNAIICRFLIKS